MDKPTREQIKEFWEKLADEVEHFAEDRHRHYRFGTKWEQDEPPLDLNNLFKYAIPKLGNYNLTLRRYNNLWSFIVGEPLPTGERLIWTDGAPALALFWAIWEVIHGS